MICFDLNTSHAEKSLITFDKPVVIFRLDDVVFIHEKGSGTLNYDQSLQISIIEEFIARNIPITLGVIPYWEDQETTINNRLVERFGHDMLLGTVEVAQHGFRHRSSREKDTEFRFAPYSSQIEWIQRGKEILKRGFPSRIATFVPPWNNFDSNTIRSLIELEFNCLSGDLGPIEWSNENLKYASNNSIAYIPASCSFREVKHAVELALSLQCKSKQYRNFMVVCFHPYDFVSSAKQPISKSELNKALDELKRMPVEFATLSAVANHYSEELSLSHQVQAARVESLGKTLKLIPRLGFVLPADYNFGRWIPFGVYLTEHIYNSIEQRLILKISALIFIIWILFIEISRLIFRTRIHAWNTAIWFLISLVFSLSLISYFIFLPERKSVAFVGFISMGLCLIYLVIRIIFL